MHCRVLDLFSGSKSVAKALGWQNVSSVDIDPKTEPEYCVDILSFDLRQYMLPGDFDVVWASPPCTQYSKARWGAPRDLESADALVRKTLEIIAYLQPQRYFIENPASGMLKDRPVIAGIPWVDVDLCRYGMEYKKPTRIWGTVAGFQPKRCTKDTRCEAYLHAYGRHPVTLTNCSHGMNRPRLYNLMQQGIVRGLSGAAARAAMPPALIRELCTFEPTV